MKQYPFLPCPKCGAGLSDEGSESGLVIQFAPQHDCSNLKSRGTIFYVLCLDCGYIGPLVLCPTGLSLRMISEAWNNHINPTKSISTADLVKELSGREGVELVDACDPSYRYIVGVGLENKSIWDKYIHDSGPAKILVVKEE